MQIIQNTSTQNWPQHCEQRSRPASPHPGSLLHFLLIITEPPINSNPSSLTNRVVSFKRNNSFNTMKLQLLSILLVSVLTLKNVCAFHSRVSTTSTPKPEFARKSQLRQNSDTSLHLLPNPFAVSTALLQNRQTATFIDTTKASSSSSLASSYSDMQRPVISYSEQRSRNLLAPAVDKISQVVVDLKSAASNLSQTASKLGVSFGLSYSLLSQINGGITLAVAWYMTCQRTGVSPVYQWKALLKSYGTLYAFLQAIKPFRIAAAISIARFSQKWLDATQERFQCGRGTAVAVQYATGYGLQAIIATIGVGIASAASGVPIFASP